MVEGSGGRAGRSPRHAPCRQSMDAQGRAALGGAGHMGRGRAVTLTVVPPAEVVEKVNKLITRGQYGRLFAVVHFASHQWKVTSEDLILIENKLDVACGERIRLEKVRPWVSQCTWDSVPAPQGRLWWRRPAPFLGLGRLAGRAQRSLGVRGDAPEGGPYLARRGDSTFPQGGVCVCGSVSHSPGVRCGGRCCPKQQALVSSHLPGPRSHSGLWNHSMVCAVLSHG